METFETDTSERLNRPLEGAPVLVSLIVPIYNEQASIEMFVNTVQKILEPLKPSIQTRILFVNDGSKDGSEFAIRSLMQNDPTIGLVNLSRNFGKEAALGAGLEHAAGDAVIPLDVDLQDDPSVIPEMIEKWRNGADVVNARRGDRSKDSWAKRTTAKGFYGIFNFLADHPMPTDVGDFRLLDRKVVDVLRTLGERVRLNKALFSWVGFNVEEVVFDRQSRNAGMTTMPYWRLWNLALDGIFTSSTKPLRIWTYLGSFLAAISFIYASFVFFRTLVFGIDLPGYSSTMILILMFGGLNLFAVGILGEYIGRILEEVRERPLYVVRSMHGISNEDDSE